MATGTAAERTRQLTEACRADRDDLVAFARRRLFGDVAVAEEAVQDTFLRAWRSLDRFDPASGTMRTWLFAICRNAAADAARTRARQRRSDTAAATGCEADTDSRLDQLTARWYISDALRVLPAWQRDAVVAVHLHERPYADVARDLGVPVGTVKSRVHLGLRSARAALVAA